MSGIETGAIRTGDSATRIAAACLSAPLLAPSVFGISNMEDQA